MSLMAINPNDQSRIATSISQTSRRIPISTMLVLLSLLGMILLESPAWGQFEAKSKHQKSALADRAVDSLRFQNHRLVGIIFRRTKTHLWMAVERRWLKDAYPDSYAKWAGEDKKRQKEIATTFYSRMDSWIREVRQDEPYVKLLESEIIRFQDQQEPEKNQQLGQYRFIPFKMELEAVSKIRSQPLNHKRVAALAWKNNLGSVSIRSFSDLRKELQDKKVDIDRDYFNLSVELPPASLTKRQWNIRRAMFDRYEAGSGLEFQGQGEQLFEKGDDVNLSKIMSAMAGAARNDSIAQLGRELGLPEFAVQPKGRESQKWVEHVTKIADQKRQRSIMVKRILESANADLVTVEVSFLAKSSDTEWEVVVQAKSQARLSAQPQERVDQLLQDPQVQKAIALTKQLGLGGEARLQKALRQGAATQEALRLASEQVDQVLVQNSSRIEGPWLLD